jgi:hypothetical protein
MGGSYRAAMAMVTVGVCFVAHACGGSQTNSNNTVCMPDETLCGASCAALFKDPGNCGTCGTRD